MMRLKTIGFKIGLSVCVLLCGFCTLSKAQQAQQDQILQSRVKEYKIGPTVIKKDISNKWQLKDASFHGFKIEMELGTINTVSRLEVESKGQFISLGVDKFISNGKVGYPALPRMVKIIEIPQGATPVANIIKDKTQVLKLSELLKQDPAISSDIASSVSIYPVQPPIKKDAKELPEFNLNFEAYSTKGYIPNQLVEIEIIGESRGVRMAKLTVSPIEYNPRNQTLKIHTELNIEVYFENADKSGTLKKKALYHSDAFNGVYNYAINSRSLQEPKGASSSASQAKSANFGPKQMTYVIVSSPKFKDSLQEFVQWKTLQGFNVIEAYTNDPKVGTTNKSIQTYLKGLYTNATELSPAPSYILLVGDTKEIPPFGSRCQGIYDDNTHITDLYFSEFTDDYLPDAFLGRFSAETVSELMPQIRKTMQMSIISLEDASFMDTTLLIAGNDSRFGHSHLNPVLEYIRSNYGGSSNDVTSYIYKYPSSSQSINREEIIKRFSTGAGFIIYTGHGFDAEWSDPLISTTTLEKSIFNKDKYPFAIGNCCLTGKFDSREPCFGEALLRAENKGAVGYIGATNSSFFNEDFYWSIGYTDIKSGQNNVYTYEGTSLGTMDCFYHTHEEAFSDWARTGPEIIYKGNMAVLESGDEVIRYYWEIYELFGDPSYMPQKNTPAKAKIECEDIIIYGETDFNVKTDPYAQAALSIDGRLLAVASADENGDLTIKTDNVEIGEVLLYVRNQFKSDAVKKIEVISPKGKYISLKNIAFYEGEDVVSSLKYGKSYNISAELSNVGNENINKVRIEVSSSDQYFKAGEAYIYSSAINVGQNVSLDKVLSFSILPDVPDMHVVEFNIKLTIEDEEGKSIIKLQKLIANAPKFDIVSFYVNDSVSGNSNHILDPNETAEMVVKIKNTGTIKAGDPKISYSSNRTYIELPKTETSIGSIEPGASAELKFEIKALDLGQRYSIYTVNINARTDERNQSLDFDSYVAPVIETFETGDLSFVEWDPSSDWTVTDSKAHNGKYSAVSANIKDGEKSRLKITTDSKQDDYVGFFYKTSTESMNNVFGDFLEFYINDTLRNSWAGEKDWNYIEYPVAKGINKFEWVYTKDESNKDLEDKVWIDDVRLPIGAHAPLANEKANNGRKNNAVPLFVVVGSANNELDLLFNTDKDIEGRMYIINSVGERLMELSSDIRLSKGESRYSFNISTLNTGMYICVFENARIESAVKFIKNK